jgi:hypothetical protein
MLTFRSAICVIILCVSSVLCLGGTARCPLLLSLGLGMGMAKETQHPIVSTLPSLPADRSSSGVGEQITVRLGYAVTRRLTAYGTIILLPAQYQQPLQGNFLNFDLAGRGGGRSVNR